ncbi:Com family DNA-binding transcriptional regulator [Verrucomicrobiota bacterium sgz303538]
MGGGNTDLLCGHCEWVLAHRVDPDLIPESVIKCPRCDQYNHSREPILN